LPSRDVGIVNNNRQDRAWTTFLCLQT